MANKIDSDILHLAAVDSGILNIMPKKAYSIIPTIMWAFDDLSYTYPLPNRNTAPLLVKHSRMKLEAKINGYYRAVLSSISERNSRETNLVLLREVLEASPKLVKSACDIIHSGQIAKVTLTLNQCPTTQCFYSIPSIDGTNQFYVMNGYCSCYQFAENVLVRSSAFTIQCKHELACIIIEHMGTYVENSVHALLHSVEELEEEAYLERMHLICDI